MKVVNCDIIDSYYKSYKRMNYGIQPLDLTEKFTQTILFNHFDVCPEYSECDLSLIDSTNISTIKENIITKVCNIQITKQTSAVTNCGININL